MRRVAFQDILYRAARRLGVDPLRGGLQANLAEELTQYIELRVENQLEQHDWPGNQVTEERVYMPRWSDLDSEDIGADAVVYHAGAYWRALVSGPEDEPSAASTQWLAADDVAAVIDLDQDGQTAIGKVIAVHPMNPQGIRNPAMLDFVLKGNALEILCQAPASVWVVYSLRAPRLTAIEWDADAAYSQGDLVYYGPGKDCYIALSAHGNIAPPVAVDRTEYWQRQSIPYELGRYAEVGAAADALKADGQVDKGRALDKDAEKILDDEAYKLVVTQGQAAKWQYTR